VNSIIIIRRTVSTSLSTAPGAQDTQYGPFQYIEAAQ
jgi:hypothetical protein